MIDMEQMRMMIAQLNEVDFSDTPNLNALVAIRDYLEETYDVDFANNFVSRMDIDVSAASPEEATELGELWAPLCEKFIEVMFDSGFKEKHICEMADTISLTYRNT
jgi:hypothetical protein